jgi:CBS domain-containing protein
MQCNEIMKSDVQTIDEDATIQEAALKMAASRVGFLPICDASGKVLGTITDRDIALRAVAQDRLPSACRVGEIMTREVISCLPTDSLGTAEQSMIDHRKSRLLIIDQSGVLLGVISLSDIAQRDHAHRAAITFKHVAARESRS